MTLIAARAVLPIEDRYDRAKLELRYLPRDMYRWKLISFKRES